MRLKTVIVLRAGLPPGVAANTAAVLAISVGADRPDLVGPDIPDADGAVHRGLVTIPVPILAGNADVVDALAGTAVEGVAVTGFTTTAARCHDYVDYTAALAATPSAALEHLGVALVGPVRAVVRLTGDLPLYR